MAKANEKATKPAFTPKVIKQVTMPNLKLEPGVPVYVKVTDPIYDGKERKAKEGEEQQKPPKIINVINLETGEANTLVCGAVVVSELDENYEGNSYVGKCFMIEKGKKKEGAGGRGYFTYSIAEIEDPS